MGKFSSVHIRVAQGYDLYLRLIPSVDGMARTFRAWVKPVLKRPGPKKIRGSEGGI